MNDSGTKVTVLFLKKTTLLLAKILKYRYLGIFGKQGKIRGIVGKKGKIKAKKKGKNVIFPMQLLFFP